MNKKDLNYFEKRLRTQMAELEQELDTVGDRNPQKAGGWEANSGGIEVDNADENEVADKFEELEENSGIVSQLDSELTEVKAALDRIAQGTYGLCEKCGLPIERERLEANPSARISIKHAH